jgi:hypothetical protein
MNVPKSLLLDDFSAHWTGEMISKACELNVTTMKILSCLTSICQPTDIIWNKPIKSYLKNEWSEKLQ